MIELMIAMVLFIIVMLIVLDSFVKVINYNRRAVQNQALQDHSEFLFQMLSREIRFAKINYSGKCNGFNNNFGSTTFNQVYSLGTNDASDSSKKVLLFENANNECVALSRDLSKPSLVITRCAYSDTINCYQVENWRIANITPTDLIVEQFDVSVTNFANSAQSSRHTPASVHYYLRLKSAIWDNTAVELDNFITARNAEQF